MGDFRGKIVIKDYCSSLGRKELALEVPYHLAIFFTVQLES